MFGNYSKLVLLGLSFLVLVNLPEKVLADTVTVTQTQWGEMQNPDAEILKGFALNSGFPDQTWWQNFHDPTLTGYISAALKNNPDLQNATLHIAEAQALMKEVRSQEFPTVALEGNFVRERTGGAAIGSTGAGGSTSNPIPTSGPVSTTYNVYSIPVVATYQLDLWGKNFLQTQSARKAIAEEEQAERAFALTIITNVATAYFNLIRTDALIQTEQALIANAQQSIAIQQKLFQTGVIAYDVVLVTSEDLASYEQAFTQYKGQQGLYAHQLMILTGVNPKTQTDIARETLDELSFPVGVPSGVPSELLTHRPDIIQNELALQQAHINISVARRQFFPTINLTGSLGYASTELSQLVTWEDRAASLIAQLAQPLFTGGAFTANLNLQKVRAQEQLRVYQSVILTAYQQVENSLSSLKADYSGYQSELAERNASQKVTDLNQRRFDLGISPRLDVLTAQRQMLTFQLLVNQNKATSLIDLVNLYSALGGGFSS